jgi:parvulin-like peptidyl-prolyl isomerase
MKKIFPFLLFFLILGLNPSGTFAKEMLDRIVAVVNDEVVTQSELDRQLAPIYQSFKKQYKGPEFFTQMSKARVQVLNQMIEDKLVLQEARDKKVKASDAEVNQKIDEFRERFRSPNDFQEFLDGQGITLSKLKQRYSDMVLIQKMHAMAVRARIVVSPLEAKRFYEEHPEEFETPKSYFVRSITIRKKPDDHGASQQKLEDLRGKIIRGETEFAEAAIQHSEDTHAEEGGDMGALAKGQFIPHLEEAIFKLKSGEMTVVLESEIGYHVFKMDAIEEAKTAGFEEVKDKIEGMLYYQKSKEKFDKWITKLREDAYISIR